MRRLATTLFLATSLLALAPLANAQTTSASSLNGNLSLGSSGPEVLALQRLLNESSSTQIAASGPGSPGHETNYFGPLTKAAVIRFQNLYASSVLSPVGLTRGNGFVGPHTRAKLLALSQSVPASVATTQNVAPVQTQTPVATAASVTASAASTSSNPNLAELPYVLSVLNKNQEEHNVSAQDIAKIDAQVQTIMSTTTDLKAVFLRQTNIKAYSGNILSMAPPSSPKDFVTNLLIALGIVQSAYAATGISWGGILASAIPCTCSGDTVWLLILAHPVPPTYAEVLSDMPSSQIFMSHTIPHTAQQFVGFYEPGVQACYFIATPCAPAYEEGLVSPFSGSSII